MVQDNPIELAELVRNLRRELEVALVQGEGETLRFELGPVEVEAVVTLQRDLSAGGKVRFWVVETGSDLKAGASHAQRITLTLQPKVAAVDGSLRTAVIAGDEFTGER
ncbi:trypco2 family protein [Streptomyces sp. NPDC000070]|uniref:trypco2 family protein n=1 Tax=Streptomyces sp. NPDC000070 TaxID=3154240 RepID=UPI0033213ACD